jgi:hypothetical protein
MKILKVETITPVNRSEKQYTLIFEAPYAPITLRQEMFDRHKFEDGWYYVLYPDGYVSFSPPDAFESGYFLIDGRNVLGNALAEIHTRTERIAELRHAVNSAAAEFINAGSWLRDPPLEFTGEIREAFIRQGSRIYKLGIDLQLAATEDEAADAELEHPYPQGSWVTVDGLEGEREILGVARTGDQIHYDVMNEGIAMRVHQDQVHPA